jgi:CheY-like chemotaxis protein
MRLDMSPSVLMLRDAFTPTTEYHRFKIRWNSKGLSRVPHTGNQGAAWRISMKTDGEAIEPLKILIVEDEILLAMDLEWQLTTLGQEVVGIAPDAKQALDVASTTSPDLVLVDLNLRDGLTGPRIASKLAHDHAALVVFVTGSPEHIPADYAGALGAIIKPYDARTLEQLINFVHSRRRGQMGSSGAPAKMKMAPSLGTDDDIALGASYY